MPEFLPGLQLAERYYSDAVRPILETEFPGLPHSAGLIGSGSEVLGYDTPVSVDHHWGPRAMLFLEAGDHARWAGDIREALRQRLPHTFLGWPTNFADPDPADHGTQLLLVTHDGPVNHRVELLNLPQFRRAYLGYDPDKPLGPLDWLTLPSQKLRSIVSGAVFHDDVGLEAFRAEWSWYPHDVWLWLLAAGWKRIGQGEHLMGRAGQVGDELGSSLIASRLVGDAMRLCFLMERRYAPYAKWLGTAFGGLEAASILRPRLWRVLRAATWPDRDRALGEVYSAVAAMHNRLGLTQPLSADTRSFFGRPFTVIFGERFSTALKDQISDARLRRIPFDIGGIDQWSDSTDLLAAAALRPRLIALYEKEHPQ